MRNACGLLAAADRGKKEAGTIAIHHNAIYIPDFDRCKVLVVLQNRVIQAAGVSRSFNRNRRKIAQFRVTETIACNSVEGNCRV